ncbi:MAG TPA: alpha/beta hydrolase [Sphingomonadaceae bacterium]|nr:alpha/beta hydrolase [Sphingomonadaceae bacterium]
MALETRRIPLSTGVELDVTVGGAADGDPILFLHGFPESRRTWRHQLADLGPHHPVAAPDQRGYAGSSKPPREADYRIDRLVADVLALADALGWGRITLAGHDWGGAVAWATALGHPDRVARLVIANAPHPLIFQRSLFDDPAQRAASQYINRFRMPAGDVLLPAAAQVTGAVAGWETLFAKIFEGHADLGKLTAEDRAQTIAEWRQPGAMAAMLNWYRASPIVVPRPDEDPPRPPWLDAPFPSLAVSTLVVWGMKDTALLPVQLEGLDELVSDLTLVPVPEAGHFVTWEAPAAVTAAIRDFLVARPISA